MYYYNYFWPKIFTWNTLLYVSHYTLWAFFHPGANIFLSPPHIFDFIMQVSRKTGFIQHKIAFHNLFWNLFCLLPRRYLYYYFVLKSFYQFGNTEWLNLFSFIWRFISRETPQIHFYQPCPQC